MGAPGNVGLAHEAAIRVGASTDLMDQAWWSPGLTHPDGRSAFALWFTGGIFVNQLGHRFVNESAPYDRIGREIITQMAADELSLPFWMVYDDREGIVPPSRRPTSPWSRPTSYRQAGLWRSAETLADLAEAIGVPAANLVETVARYNALVANGRRHRLRPWRRGIRLCLLGGQAPLVPIDQPPFHAAAFGLSDPGTKGGLRTDTHARVLDESDRPIPGLYAAGNTMAAVSGLAYPGGGNPSVPQCCSATWRRWTWPGQARGERCRRAGRPRARQNALHAVDRRGSPACRCPIRSEADRESICAAQALVEEAADLFAAQTMPAHSGASDDRRRHRRLGKCGDRPAERHRPAAGHPPRRDTGLHRCRTRGRL